MRHPVTYFNEITGNLAFETGKDIEQVVQGGTGLAFISYPDAIAKFDVVPQVKFNIQIIQNNNKIINQN